MTSAALEANTVSETFTSDPQWYKDAVIYQLHVRAYADDSQDGIGDFRGLTEKLDYIQRLGVTAIWLLPFFPSPLKDDGYDISNYTSVNPIYGKLKDFKAFLKEAHRRHLRVITELVMNHTSDDHEWFQKSRHAEPGSKWRDYYVWSDTPDKYQDARIIFQDFEASNWTWDPVAKAYFWHRFYSHQPDLNFENPEVRKAMFKAIDFWFDMGVDGVRLDAVPYLYEEEGTNCENLKETHGFLKKLRAHVDEKYEDRMLLAEANQWPEDAAAYFGDGDECHMNFHFPLMPRLFMAIEREERFPILDILDQTPQLPDNCQWAIFLRNHDELTLEMVTDEERDYMYRAYADDPQARVNLGIRRRLAPLLKNDRRKIELMNALLFSLPGTPVVYYGDEIGMGDNIYLGDRNGVRTPMQWNADRNAGFSKANQQKLFLPTIIDSEYHYATVNVEVEENSPHSLLWWMRRIIDMRRECHAFGRGSISFLTPDNSKVLAFLREHEDQTILVVANLSRFTQCAELNLSEYRGQVPIEMFGHAKFPAIGELPYFLTLGPHAFYWFELNWAADEHVEMSTEDLPTSNIKGKWDSVFRGRAKSTLQNALKPFLRRHRWFAGKARTIQSIELTDAFPIPTSGACGPLFLLLVQSNYTEGEPETYALPVVFAGEEQAANILGDHPAAGILAIHRTDKNDDVTLCDATWEAEFWTPFLESVTGRRDFKGKTGELTGRQTKAFRRVHGENGRVSGPHVHGGQQSNTSAIFENRMIMKLFRRVTQGINPDFEVGRFLTEETNLDHVPDVAGAIEYVPNHGDAMTVAVLHEFVPNQGDAWVYVLEELGRYYDRVRTEWHEPHPPAEIVSKARLLDRMEADVPETAHQMIGGFLAAAEQLGQRTAQMHVALASGKEKSGFATEPFSKLYRRSLYQTMRGQTRKAFQLLKKQLPNLSEASQADAEVALKREDQILESLRELVERDIIAMRARCHGDLHLGQILFTGKDFMIIDFEGEPERPLGERRIKTSPLKDVAGMIRSFHYATYAGLLNEVQGANISPDDGSALQQWARVWYGWTTATFMKAYLGEESVTKLLPPNPDNLRVLMDSYILQKMVYELTYELNNRPDWVTIPLQGLIELTN